MTKQTIRAKGEGSVFKRASTGKWHAQVFLEYKENGQPKYVTRTCNTKREASEVLDKLRQEINSGFFDPNKTTVKDYLEIWLDSLSVKPRTKELYTHDVKKHIIPRIGSIQLTKLKAIHVDRLLRDVQTASAAAVKARQKVVPKDAGVRAAQLVRTTLVNALNKAVKKDLIPSNPAAKSENLKKQKTEMQIWSVEETVQFLDSTTVQDHRLYALFYLMVFTGLRRGEAMALRWSDLNGHTLKVQRTLSYVASKVIYSTPKTERSNRVLSITDDVLAILEAHKEKQANEKPYFQSDEDLIFPSKVGKAIIPSNYTKLWKALLRSAGVRYVSPHKLRHLAASLMIRKGANANEVSKQLGHVKTSFTQDVYVHVFAEQQSRSLLGIEDLRGETPRIYN